MGHEESKETFGGKWYQHPPMRNALISGLITGVAFILGHSGLIPNPIEIGMFIIAILIGGYHWTMEGIEEFIEEREIGIEMLMIGATIGSAVLGMWDEAAFLVFLYGAAEGLEEYTYAKTRHSIRKLMDLAPKEAHLLVNGEEKIIPATELKPGDRFLVRPGESIPTDGIVIKGNSYVDESSITGESIPVGKKEGMKVFAGTLNKEGILEIETTAKFEDNTLSKLIHLVEEAQEQKSRTQLFIEKFGKVYSPIVLLSSLIMIGIAIVLQNTEWATRAVVLLVAAAPCALIMSTPVAVAAGIGRAGKAGILIKGGGHLENLGKLKAIAFDKTGTLTTGKPVVTDVISFEDGQQDILQIAYSIEKYSEHPLARAIVEYAENSGIKPFEMQDFFSITGYGAKARVNGSEYFIGKEELFKHHNNHQQDTIRKLRDEGKTVVLIGTAEKLLGAIAIRDEIREEAKLVIDRLHKMGIKTVMLTGDNAVTAKAISRELGMDDVRADLRPEDKLKAIQELEKEYGVVAMIGDGINDAPALARATVGIAMGVAGTDAALEAADVALMADDLRKVLEAIEIGKKARGISKQNIIFSLLILVVLIPSSLIGWLSVAGAVFYHEASELLAVANGVRVGNANN